MGSSWNTNNEIKDGWPERFGVLPGVTDLKRFVCGFLGRTAIHTDPATEPLPEPSEHGAESMLWHSVQPTLFPDERLYDANLSGFDEDSLWWPGDGHEL